MSTDNTSDEATKTDPVEPAATPEPEQADDSGASLSAEAKGWRLKYQDAQAAAAKAVLETVDVAAKLAAAQRQVIDQHLAGRIHSAADFHSRVDHASLLSDVGAVDFGKVDAALSSIVEGSPYLAPPAPGTPLTVPPSAVTGTFGQGDSRIGYPNASVLNPSVPPPESTTWATVLGDAAKQR